MCCLFYFYNTLFRAHRILLFEMILICLTISVSQLHLFFHLKRCFFECISILITLSLYPTFYNAFLLNHC